MESYNIPFAKVPIAENEKLYLNEVIESGWLTTSSKAFRFEKEFAEFIGCRFACAVNSCTSALHLALDSIGIGPGDKVMVPSLTFTASAEVIRYQQANPIFIDVEYETGLITPSILKTALARNKDVKAIILVHYGGQTAQMTDPQKEGILDICKNYNVEVIEDAAHAFPSRFGGQFAGNFGRIGCFSFYANKTITTGEGGMLITNDESIYKRVRIMRLHGINRDIWARFTSDRPDWEYDVVEAGYKYNMPDINAAIGIAQLENAEYFREKRQSCAEFYMNEFSGLKCIDLPVCRVALEDHAWHLFPVVIKPEAGISRNKFIELMAKEKIGTSVHYKPLHRMTYYKEKYNLREEDFPNTEKIWKGTVSLPIYPELSTDNLLHVCKIVKRILN